MAELHQRMAQWQLSEMNRRLANHWSKKTTLIWSVQLQIILDSVHLPALDHFIRISRSCTDRYRHRVVGPETHHGIGVQRVRAVFVPPLFLYSKVK